jgi:DNA helicase HerA-like ATPase
MDGIMIVGDRRVGRIIAVSASQAVVLLERGGDAGDEHVPLEIGTLVKMRTRVSTVYGMVTGLRVPLPGLDRSDQDLKVVELELAGETVHTADGGAAPFRRGVSAYPALDEAVYSASMEDLMRVYARPSVATACIGTIHQDPGVPAYILTNELLGKHFSIVGTTGSGKSCVVATILGAVIERNPHAHVMLLDPHNEYASAFGNLASVLSPADGLYLPYWLFNFEEILEIVGFGEQPEQAKILHEAIVAAKQPYFSRIGLDKHGTVETPAPYRLSDVYHFLDVAMGSLSRPEHIANYLALKSRLQRLQADSRYNFVFQDRLLVRDELPDLLAKLFRIPVDGKPITILDLSGIPSEVLNVVVSVLCRVAFDFALWSEIPIPVTIVCEEAHRYAPRDKGLGFEPAKRALSRIAKEGRKYGVSLCVVSQRPSDLAPGLLSECNTMFALRMTNQVDQDIVRGAVPEASHGLMNFLPALRNGEAIVVGEGVSMPMRICFATLPENRRPKSATASFTTAWAQECDASHLQRTVDRWRRGLRYPAAA